MSRDDTDTRLSGSVDDALREAFEPMSWDARMSVRRRVMMRVHASALPRRTKAAYRGSAAVLVALSMSAAYVPAAAAAALPGDALYGVKRAVEAARISASIDGYRDVLLGAAAEERAQELAGLVTEGAVEERVSQAALDFEKAAGRAFGNSDKARERSLRKAVEDKPARVESRVRDAVEKAHGPGHDHKGKADESPKGKGKGKGKGGGNGK